MYTHLYSSIESYSSYSVAVMAEGLFPSPCLLASAAAFGGVLVGTILSGESLMCHVKPAVLLFGLIESKVVRHPFYT